MKISANGLELIKRYEGLRLKAYKDPAGVLTIGYGHTSGVKSGDVITEEKATEYLQMDVVKAEAQVLFYNDRYNFNQNEFDALVSFAFNIGSIHQLTQNGKRTKYQIAQHIPAYCNAGGKKLQGLVNRRREELKLYNTPVIEEKETKTTYKVNSTYTVVVNALNVRSGPGTTYAKAIKTKYNKGKKVTVKNTSVDASGNLWLQLTTGNWICAIYEGKTYVE